MTLEEILNEPVAREVNQAIPGSILDAKFALNELTLTIDPARIVEVCRHLKGSGKFVRVSSITAVDWFPAEPRFEVVYHLRSMERNLRVRLKCRLSEDQPSIETVSSVWGGANWYEREIFDLFGIVFENHPNLKRILMPDDWEGYPLRKDFPVHGHKYSYQDE